MKREYDFSSGERGNFFDPKAKYHFPIYLDDDIQQLNAQIYCCEVDCLSSELY